MKKDGYANQHRSEVESREKSRQSLEQRQDIEEQSCDVMPLVKKDRTLVEYVV